VDSFEKGGGLPVKYQELYTLLKSRFHVALVPRREGGTVEIPLDELPARWIDPRPVEVPVGKLLPDTPFRLPLGRPDGIDIAFEVPASVILTRWEKIQAETGRPLRGELFDFRMFPRIDVQPDSEDEGWSLFAEALKKGDWIEARRLVKVFETRISKEGLRALPNRAKTTGNLRALAAEIRDVVKSFSWFREWLHPVAHRVDLLADAIEEVLPPAEAEIRLRDVGIAIGQFLDNDPSPAPVFLDEPAPADPEFTFIVGADLQYDTDASCFQQFLTAIDPSRESSAGDSSLTDVTTAAGTGGAPSDLRRAKFALIVGDFGDGKGLSSTPTAAFGDALGLSAPHSPYAEQTSTPRHGEFPELREMLRRAHIPIFVVPGNHDGFVNYGGILNQLTLVAGRLLNALPILGFLGDPLVSISNDLPVLVKIWRVSPPFYDGLVDWSLELGPRNLAFQYRGCGFVAANSFDLHQFARDQVGALANNWGGALQDSTLTWVDSSLRHFPNVDRDGRNLTPLLGTSFLFMHHDPRGSLASKNGYVEKNFGHYNTVTTPMTELTFGYLGTSSAFFTNLWIPILSPIATEVVAAARSGEDFQERWMRDTGWDEMCSNAKPLLEVINRNLTGAPDEQNPLTGALTPGARLSHLFFGHDDVPIVAPWIHPNGNNVFPEQTSDLGWDSFGDAVEGFFVRRQSEHAPSWASRMHFDDGRQATVVRLDDLGDAFSNVNTHGFSVVTVKPVVPAAGAAPRTSVRWVPLSR
jgi:hypothetical protein